MTAPKPIHDPLRSGKLNHAPNLCLLCDGIRRQRLNLPPSGGRTMPPLPEDN